MGLKATDPATDQTTDPAIDQTTDLETVAGTALPVAAVCAPCAS